MPTISHSCNPWLSAAILVHVLLLASLLPSPRATKYKALVAASGRTAAASDALPGMAIGVGLAMLLNGVLPGRLVYRSLIFLPLAISGVATGVLGSFMFDQYNGFVNSPLCCRDVSKLMRRRQNGDNFELNAMSLNLLQLIVRQAPNLRHRFPADARSFYVQTGSRDLRVGLSAWRGFFQYVFAS